MDTGGIVLWSRSFTSTSNDQMLSVSPMNALVREALIEGRTAERFEKDGYAIKWTFVNELELIFTVRKESSMKVYAVINFVDLRWRTSESFS